MMNEIINKEIGGMGFGFYSAEEVKRLSVKQITRPYVFDSLDQVVPGGLYDKALGPHDKFDNCVTCTLPYKECLGHMGHIELSVPVYHPLLFEWMFKLLRAKCWSCHKFKASRMKLKKYDTAIQMIDAGLLLQAKDLDDMMAGKRSRADKKQAAEDAKRGGAEEAAAMAAADAIADGTMKGSKRKRAASTSDDDDASAADSSDDDTKERKESKRAGGSTKKAAKEKSKHDKKRAAKVAKLTATATEEMALPSQSEMEERLDELLASARAEMARLKAMGTPYRLSKHDHEYRKYLVGSLFKDLGSKKCMNCNAISPNLRRDGHAKIFKTPLSDKHRKSNIAQRIHLADVLTGGYYDVKAESEKVINSTLIREQQALEEKRKYNRYMGGGSKKAAAAAAAPTSDDEDDTPKDPWAGEEDIKQRLDEVYGKSEEDKKKKEGAVLLFPNEVEKHMQLLWQTEHDLVTTVWGGLAHLSHMVTPLAQGDYRMFFLRVLAIPPPKFRQTSKHQKKTFDHPQNAYFKRILEHDIAIINANVAKESFKNDDTALKREMAKVMENWLLLQDDVNTLFDSNRSSQNMKGVAPGIRQGLEKKQGLFRMHMMGKRVNFAARSVISPDPWIHTKEIGIPEYFARGLTYPEPVNAHNVKEMMQCVINGPALHPGANYVEDERGNLTDLSRLTHEARVALSKKLLTETSSESGHVALGAKGKHEGAIMPGSVKRVLRHLRNGDMLLVNRQPTLHKPSIMGHMARVLRGQQTIRMHYANCATYNADYDGDELNLHFPQTEQARAEAMLIANTNNQYVKPTDGSPLRGLIQDHVVAGVLLCKRDTFFTADEFMQLVYFPCPDMWTDEHAAFQMPIPAILKPRRLFTGKQVLTTVLALVCRYPKKFPLNLTSKARTSEALWGPGNEDESRVIFRHGQLLTGVLDKNAFGANAGGLVHSVYTLYGPEAAGDLLTILGRLFTTFLQDHGFTCGIDDLILDHKAELGRTADFVKGVQVGVTATRTAADPLPSQTLEFAMQEKFRMMEDFGALLDHTVSGAMSAETSAIVKKCLPGGQMKAFPMNFFSLMTNSGAKGSLVNFTQISCLLGQLELEGRRPPVMPSGKTLPSFRKYDPTPRAGGYVTDRFLTGLRPQEYYMHSMAGREGLVDTAVKTSRAGYLQRCLIKHLESLKVSYDNTVRDNDGSVIQFHYGEDAIDVAKSGHLGDFAFASQNYMAMLAKFPTADCTSKMDQASLRDFLENEPMSSTSTPLLSEFNPGVQIGAVSHAYAASLDKFMKTLPDDGISSICSADDIREGALPKRNVKKGNFEALMKLAYAGAVVPPGEVVGILCAQSIGEPATQMTLNTFHLAGAGAGNVTLGIPRLREIIMTASAKIKTPVMEAPMLRPYAAIEAKGQEVAAKLNAFRLVDYVRNISLHEGVEAKTGHRLYTVRLFYVSVASGLRTKHGLSAKLFHDCFEKQFLVKLNALIKKTLKQMERDNAIDVTAQLTAPKKRKTGGIGYTINMDDDDTNGGVETKTKAKRNDVDEDASSASRRSRNTNNVEYDDGDDEDAEIQKDQDDAAQLSDDDDDAAAAALKKKKKKQEKKEKVEKREPGDDDAVDEAEEDDRDEAEIDADTTGGRKKTVTLEFLSSLLHNDHDDWSEATLQIPLRHRKLLMMSLVETVYEVCLIKSTKNISRAFTYNREKKDSPAGEDGWVLKTEGINFHEVYRHSDLVDINRIRSNDIHAMLNTYGVEAARSTIINEIMGVFKHYSISVNPRHIGLLADYMTFQGGFNPLNRMGLDANSSPLQKICFETSIQFMMAACLSGDVDRMSSPSSRLVVGAPVEAGTGTFQLMSSLDPFGEMPPLPVHTTQDGNGIADMVADIVQENDGTSKKKKSKKDKSKKGTKGDKGDREKKKSKKSSRAKPE